MIEDESVLDGPCHVCGADLDGPFCGDCGAWNGQGEPPSRPDRVCPVCGTVNPPNNLHCVGCAFRLDRTPEPGPSRSPLGLVVVAGVLFGLALIIVLVVNSIIGGDQEAAGTESVATTSTALESSGSTRSAEKSSPLAVSSVSASSSFSETLGPENLIDSDPSSYWNDASMHGEGAELIFEFSPPVAIESIVIQNPGDEGAFTRNYRIRGYELSTDDLPSPVAGELADTQDPQTIDFVTTSTSRLVLRVISTYEARALSGQSAFEELAVAEVTFIGTPGR